MSFPNEVFNIHELLEQFLLQSDYDAVMNLCRTNKQAGQICHTGTFWMGKAQHDFHISPQNFRNIGLSPYQRYLELYTQNGGVGIGSEQFITWGEFVRRAIRQGKRDLVQYAINHGFKNWDLILEEYAAKGDIQMINYFLTIHNNPTVVAEGLLRGHQIEIFNNFLKTAPYLVDHLDPNELAISAIKSGDLNLLKSIMQSWTPILVKHGHSWDWDEMINEALSSGNKEIYYFIQTQLPNDWIVYPNTLATEALLSGDKELYEYIRAQSPPNFNWNWDRLASGALSSGNKNLYSYVQAQAPVNWDWNWNILTYGALNSGNKDLFDYIRTQAPINYTFNWLSLVINALRSHDLKLVNYVRSLAPPNYQWNWSLLLKEAEEKDDTELYDDIQDLISKMEVPFRFKKYNVALPY